MQCKNKILCIRWNNQVKYKGGMTQVLGTSGIVKPYSDSVNGIQFEEICNGDIKISIYSNPPEMGSDCGEINFEFRCNRCDKGYGNLNFDLESLHTIIDKYIKEN